MKTTDTNNTSPDSWTLTDRCRLLANALVNPQNKGAQDRLCMMLHNQLECLEASLSQPTPEHRKDLGIPLDDGLFDYAELEPDELCEQCMALNFTLMTLQDRKIKEIIAFILWERFEMLRCSLYASTEEAA
ncbi:hypothetical protein [Rahnella perminowiae]|uniref:hypothetical protein n=1 Tax=Rahnella perminowiae TaxID=2816244 RepID=UPI001C259500|nr:hypothetical protein [Rahnella perminowiae]MBU9823710.1 hypothetical protein [Rahnella perminowiae]